MNEIDFSQPAPKGRRKVMIYGEPGTGKTLSLRTLPKAALPAYMLDLDKGSAALHESFPNGDFRGVQPNKLGLVGQKEGPVMYDQCKKELQKLNKMDPAVLKTVVVDSFTELYASILDHVMFSNNKPLASAPSQPDYGIALRLGIKFVEALCSKNKNIIMICHESTHQNEVTGVIKITPALTGQLALRLPGYFDEVLHAKVKGKGDKTGYLWETRPNGLAIARTRRLDLQPEIEQNLETIL